VIELELPREPKGRDGCWLWFTSKASSPGYSNYLPEKLFRLIEPNPEWNGKTFATREGAMAAYEAAVRELGLGKFRRGQKVVKGGGDYTFRGVVVAAFEKLSGKVRYVVENADGVLHIFSESQLAEDGP
jgi:hypothetical protein